MLGALLRGLRLGRGHEVPQGARDAAFSRGSPGLGAKLSCKLAGRAQEKKVVILLTGRYAGKKAVIIRNHDDGTAARKYGHAEVLVLTKEPRKVGGPPSRPGRGAASLAGLHRVHPGAALSFEPAAGDQAVLAEDAGQAVIPQGAGALFGLPAAWRHVHRRRRPDPQRRRPPSRLLITRT